MKLHALPLAAIALCTAGLTAQTYFVVPAGHDVLEANANNTIPFWSSSATYQQVHDGVDVDAAIGGPFALITSLNLRKDNATSPIPNRLIAVQITLGQTPVSAASATGSYATNLGAAPSVVLPFTIFNLPGLNQISVPNPIGWSFPFTTAFPYLGGQGNLCWEMRTMNSSINSFASLDAGQGDGIQSSAMFGTGCVATGQAVAAQISTRSLSMTTGNWNNKMTHGAANAPSVFLIGIGHTTIPLPGYCSSLELLPLTSLAGVTDPTGVWDNTYVFGSLVGMPAVELMGQFAFIDGGLAGGVGLSDASSFTLPPIGNARVTRIWTGSYQSGAGNETATSGIVDPEFGLVTIFGM